MIIKEWNVINQELVKKKINESKLVCGIDEVGRGPLAGPVLACAIIMPSENPIAGISDSKKLSEKRRLKAYQMIIDQALAIGIGRVDPKEIDRINIRQATHRAMEEAIANLKTQNGESISPDLVLVDAEQIQAPCEQLSIVKGDDRIYTIACASIVAKVKRDQFMIQAAEKYPEYAFDKHKGYGTKAHYQALREYGYCPLHRLSFLHGEDIEYENRKYFPSEC